MGYFEDPHSLVKQSLAHAIMGEIEVQRISGKR
jgi:hypothetical protein